MKENKLKTLQLTTTINPSAVIYIMNVSLLQYMKK